MESNYKGSTLVLCSSKTFNNLCHREQGNELCLELISSFISFSFFEDFVEILLIFHSSTGLFTTD